MNYIKVNSLNGRMGHQLAEWNTSLSVAEYYGLKLIHTPLNYGWENKLNLGKNELTTGDYDSTIHIPTFDRANIEEIRHIIENKDRTLFILSQGQNLESHWITENTLKLKYLSSSINKPFTNGFNVGLHIRRGDVNKSRYPTRWLDNDYYINIVEDIIKPKYDNFNLHIFSEGNESNFKEFDIYKPTYHLNGDEYQSFNYMVKCDVLVTGKSGYSYFASIISENDIIATPFWHSYPDSKRIYKL